MPPAVDRLAKALHAINVAALGVWLGSLVATGALAATVFPMMRDLRPTLAAYSAYSGDHAPLTAGHVAARAFLTNDFVQFICAGLGLLSLGVLIIIQLRRAPSKGGGRSARVTLRALTFGSALAVFCVQFFMVAPGMDATLRQYWSAAAAGDSAAAETFRTRFAEAHPLASTLMATTAALVLLSLLTAAWPARSPLPGAPAGGADDPASSAADPAAVNSAPRGPKLEPPALLRGRP